MLGRKGKLAVELALVVSQAGFCVAYVLFIGENVADVIRQESGQDPGKTAIVRGSQAQEFTSHVLKPEKSFECSSMAKMSGTDCHETRLGHYALVRRVLQSTRGILPGNQRTSGERVRARQSKIPVGLRSLARLRS